MHFVNATVKRSICKISVEVDSSLVSNGYICKLLTHIRAMFNSFTHVHGVCAWLDKYGNILRTMQYVL